MTQILHIKNMVCPRCSTAVQRIFSDLDIDFKSVQLGEVLLSTPINSTQNLRLEQRLSEGGFELLEDQCKVFEDQCQLKWV